MAFKSNAVANIGLVGSPSQISATVASLATHTVIGLSISNTSTAPITVSAKLAKSGGATVFLLKDASVIVGSAVVVVGGPQKVVLETGDVITCYSSAASSADATISYLV